MPGQNQYEWVGNADEALDKEINEKAKQHLKKLNMLQLKTLFQMGTAFIEIYKLGFKDGLNKK